VRRLLLVVAVAGLWAGLGSALLASPALAGGVDTNTGFLAGALYNLTPYTWTKVAEASPQTCYGRYADGTGGRATSDCWDAQEPAATIAPGGASGYTVEPNLFNYPVIGNLWSTQIGYDAWVTYRVDVLGGAPEYVTFTVSQCDCTGVYGTSQPRLDVWDTTAPPPASYNPGSNPNPPATQTASPQVTYAHNVPYLFDQTFQIAGNYTVDASTNLGAPFVSVLNTICGSNPSACSFTQVGPIKWGIGALGGKQIAANCVVSAGGQPAPAGATGDEPPPDIDPNWFSVEYKAAQSASFSVGGSLSVGTEFNLFDTFEGKISIKVEAEHEWTELKSFTREAKVFIPSNNIAFIWVAPTQATVTGTLVVTTESAKFTATNFSQTRDGVSRGDLTPAFNVITKIRPMTPAEFKDECGNGSSTGLGSTKALGSPSAKPPVRLVPGRGVAKLSLGQTQAAVLRALGQPNVKHFYLDPCQGLQPGCDAVAGIGGTWSYRQLSVVFGPDRRVSGLMYSGSKRSGKGVGVGSSMTAVRVAYPKVSCTSGTTKRQYCTLQGTSAGRMVTTVFRFTRTRAGRYKCDRVLIYVPAAGNGEVKG
jgi:hypothetical protein